MFGAMAAMFVLALSIVAALLLALIPVAGSIPSLGALGLVLAIMLGLIRFEAVHFSDVRERVRHEGEVVVSELAGSGEDRSGDGD